MCCNIISNLFSSLYFLFLPFLTPLASLLSVFSHCAQLPILYFNLPPFVIFRIQTVSSFPSALYLPCMCFYPCIQPFPPSGAACLSNHYHLLDLPSFLFMFPSRLYSSIYLMYPSKPHHICSIQSDSQYSQWGLTQRAHMHSVSMLHVFYRL